MGARIEIGARVAFSSHFLRSLAEAPTSPRWGDRGEVVSLLCGGILAEVRWADGRVATANVANLRETHRGAGLNEETPVQLGNAWVGMGFQAHSAEAA